MTPDTEREALARLIVMARWPELSSFEGDWQLFLCAADAILAAGFRRAADVQAENESADELIEEWLSGFEPRPAVTTTQKLWLRKMIAEHECRLAARAEARLALSAGAARALADFVDRWAPPGGTGRMLADQLRAAALSTAQQEKSNG